jgi:hypothetical protein
MISKMRQVNGRGNLREKIKDHSSQKRSEERASQSLDITYETSTLYDLSKRSYDHRQVVKYSRMKYPRRLRLIACEIHEIAGTAVQDVEGRQIHGRINKLG